MIVSRKRVAWLLALALPALLVAGEGVGWVLCVESDGHIALEPAAQICCPGHLTGARTAFLEAAKSSGAPEPHDCDSCICGACIDLPLLTGSMVATVPASDADVSVWAQAQLFAGATLSPRIPEGVLPSFPGRDRSQASAPSQLFARTISLRC